MVVLSTRTGIIVWLCGFLTTVLLAEAFLQPLGRPRQDSLLSRRLRDEKERRLLLFRHGHGGGVMMLLRSKDEDSAMLDEFPVDDLEDGTTTEEELLEMIATNQPSQFAVMKELLGLNVFTLILAILIVLFMGANFLLGPGWLGNRLGIEGTGTFQEISDAIPGIIDLSQPDYRL
jgi:hypothetical protein